MNYRKVILVALAFVLNGILASRVCAEDTLVTMRSDIEGQPYTEVSTGTTLVPKYDYYDNGKVMACSAVTPDGKIVAKRYYNENGTVSKEELYDGEGRKIEEVNYDDQGHLDDAVDGWAAKRWQYVNDVLRVESTYGEDGHLTERKFYNEAGDLVDRQYIGDDNIDPNEEFNRGSIVNYETDEFFDRYGNRTGAITTIVE